MKRSLVGAMLLLGAAGGCSRPRPAEDPRVTAVILSEAAPPAAYVRLRELHVVSGRGCGFLGSEGSFDEARLKLQREAARLEASYVQITREQKPAISHQCKEHEYRMSGVAYRRPGAAPAPQASAVAPAPAPSTASTPSTTAAAPTGTVPTTAVAAERACVPGTTQACLGPGACKGAQACREDGGGYLPCDCGH